MVWKCDRCKKQFTVKEQSPIILIRGKETFKLCYECNIDDKIEDDACDFGIKFKDNTDKENYIKMMREFNQ
jgi:hypothetical protein